VGVYLRWLGKTDMAREALAKAREISKKPNSDRLIRPSILIDTLDRKYEDALDKLLSLKDVDRLWCAGIYRCLADEALADNRPEEANKYHKEARKYCEEIRDIMLQRIADGQGYAWRHSSLGLAYAGLGDKENAIREGELAVELERSLSKDPAMTVPDRIMVLAQIYVLVDEHEKAIDKLENVLEMPARMSRKLIKLNPCWDPLRKNPRFQELLKGTP
jgi:tetratricopeptide (TPR) repeat protein